MNIRLLGILLLCGAMTAAADQVRVRATRQLDSRKSSGNQNLGFGRTSLTQKEYYYRFEIQSTSPQLANPVKVEWAVMYEDWEGRVRPGVRGSCETNVPMAKATIVETETVHLNQRNWQGAGGHSGKIEDKIAGYGLRISDKNGNIIDEEYDPASLKREIDWKMVQGQPNEDALKAIQTLLGGGQQNGGGGPRQPPPGRLGQPRRP